MEVMVVVVVVVVAVVAARVTCIHSWPMFQCEYDRCTGSRTSTISGAVGNHRWIQNRAAGERRYTGDASKVTPSGCAAAASNSRAYRESEVCWKRPCWRKRGSFVSGGTTCLFLVRRWYSVVVPHFISPRMKKRGRQ